MRDFTEVEKAKIRSWRAWSTLDDIQVSVHGRIYMEPEDIRRLSLLIREFVIESGRVIL